MDEIKSQPKSMINGSSLLKNKSNSQFILFYLLIILVLTYITYTTALRNDFAMKWDDDALVVNNNTIKDLSINNIWKIFTNFKGEVNNYLPITTISYALEYKFFGLNPTVYHTDNVIIHLLNVILVFFFIYLLTSPQSTVHSPQIFGLSAQTSDFRPHISALVALFFAVHPLNVQAVAWISARCIVLYTLFFIGGLITYIRSQKSEVRSQKNKYLIFTYILFLLSLLSKSNAVTFPLVLILIDFYLKGFKLQASSYKLLLNKIPFFILAIFFGIISTYARENLALVETNSMSSYTIIDKFFFVCYSLYFYIVKSFFPVGLCVHHYYPAKSSGILPLEYYMSAGFITLIIIYVIKIKSIVLKKDIIFGILFYLINIALVIHIIPYSGYITSERYAYIPYLGLVFAVGKICIYIQEDSKLMSQNLKLKSLILISVIIIIALIFSFITHERNKIYKNNISLFTDEVEKNQGIYSHYKNRGTAKTSLGDYKGAIEDFNKAIEINPKDPWVFYFRGNSKASIGDMLGASEDFNKAIEIKPKFTEAIYSRGSAKYFLGDKEGAIEDFSKAIVLKPNYTEALNNRGMAKNYLGDNYGACKDWNKSANLGSRKAYDLIQKYCK